MKNISIILCLLLFVCWSCEESESKNFDGTLPIISITSHQPGEFVSQISTIKVTTQNNYKINRVEFYVDDSLFYIDLEFPYQFDWNTTIYADSTEHVIKAISYDGSENYRETEPLTLIVFNLDSKPTPSKLYNILFNNGFKVRWSRNNDNDFQSYKLYKSNLPDMSNKVLMFETNEINDTTYFVDHTNNSEYYQIKTEDIYGLLSSSNIEPLLIEIELWGDNYNVENTTELILVNNSLTGSIPSIIGNLTNLNTLILGGNDLSGPIPIEIGNLNNLQNLNLQSNQLSGRIPSEIGNLINLENLNLLGNQLSGEIPSEIGNLINLNELSFSSNQLSGAIPNEICNQGDSSPDLSTNQFCPPYPDCIEVDIENQELANCNDVVELWGEYYSIEYTTEINLPSEGLIGEIPSEIGNLINLQSLNLYNNELSGHIPSEMGNLTNLTSLVLWANQLEGEIPPELGNLTNLIRLDLDENQLTGSIPPQIWALNNLNELFLSKNKLEGEIPPELGNLTNLNYFFISENQISGSIPTVIGNLSFLKYLRLNDNQFSGEIPANICNLNIFWDTLYDFNISNNQLCPPYPDCVENFVGEQDTANCN